MSKVRRLQEEWLLQRISSFAVPLPNHHASQTAALWLYINRTFGVIAIIAILAGILFPVFARARENARRSSCQSNLKQIGLGVMQYTQDYDEMFPSAEMNYNYPSTVTGPADATWDTVIQPYLKSSQILRCPSDSVSVQVNHPVHGANVSRSYTGAFNVLGALTHARAPLSIAAVPATALTVLLSERNQPNLSVWGYYSYTSDMGASLAYRHLETSNFLYCDGHVKALKGKTGGPYPNLPGYTLTGDGSANVDYGTALPQ